MKDFNNWNEKKIKIDSYKKFKHPKEREIWWCSIGVNIGTEIYGKGTRYSRPVLVINAEGGQSFVGIPLTSKIKSGKYCCAVRTSEGGLSTALIYQIRNFDKRRLNERICCIDNEEYERILVCLLNLYKV